MKVWRWFAQHSKSLQGLAALTVVVAAVITVPVFLWRSARSDLTLLIWRYENTIPEDLALWVSAVVPELGRLPPETERPVLRRGVPSGVEPSGASLLSTT